MKATKLKLIIIVSRFPYPLEKGDKLRAFNQIKELSSCFEIHLIAITKKNIDEKHKNQLSAYCKSIHFIRINFWTIFINSILSLLTKRPFQVGYFYSLVGQRKVNQLIKSIKPDHIYAQLIRTSEYVKNYHFCSKTLDYMDALSVGIERRIPKAPWHLRWLFKQEHHRLRNYERVIFDYFEHTTIISEQDKMLIPHPNKNKISCVPNGIAESFFEPLEISKKYDIVFVGNLNYAPNIEAVSYIAHKILAASPGISCLIAGANPSNVVEKICKKSPRITLLKSPVDIRTAYCSGKIMVAPMTMGTGMQNKLLEAMALGIPCITTKLANNAIKAIHNESIMVADTEEEYINTIHKLLEDPEFYSFIAKNGQSYIRDNYSWNKTSSGLIELIYA